MFITIEECQIFIYIIKLGNLSITFAWQNYSCEMWLNILQRRFTIFFRSRLISRLRFSGSEMR